MPDKFQRMLQLVNEFFNVKNDTEQLNITEEVMRKLKAIHPSTMSEYNEGDGPIVWILLIPTNNTIMKRFLAGEISEKQLMGDTLPNEKYDTLYLCSASVLPEYRHKGLAKKVTIEAIGEIRKEYKITSLFYWSFSPEGELLAQSIAKEVKLPLYKRQSA